jgi:hypothetical protein
MVQFGLSLWFVNNHDPTQGRPQQCSSSTYNFYLLKQNEKQDVVFLSQTNCLQFLYDHGFDLNMMVYGGISYMNEKEEEELIEIEKTNRRTKNNIRGPIIPYDSIDQESREILDKIRYD